MCLAFFKHAAEKTKSTKIKAILAKLDAENTRLQEQITKHQQQLAATNMAIREKMAANHPTEILPHAAISHESTPKHYAHYLGQMLGMFVKETEEMFSPVNKTIAKEINQCDLRLEKDYQGLKKHCAEYHQRMIKSFYDLQQTFEINTAEWLHYQKKVLENSIRMLKDMAMLIDGVIEKIEAVMAASTIPEEIYDLLRMAAIALLHLPASFNPSFTFSAEFGDLLATRVEDQISLIDEIDLQVEKWLAEADSLLQEKPDQQQRSFLPGAMMRFFQAKEKSASSARKISAADSRSQQENSEEITVISLLSTESGNFNNNRHLP